MIPSDRLHAMIPRRLYLRALALVQVIVMVMLAVPAGCYELGSEHETCEVGVSAAAGQENPDSCPCCPDDQGTTEGPDQCSTCSNCIYYVPLASVPSFRYLPSVAPLHMPERTTKLPEVHIPIFVPPQNLS